MSDITFKKEEQYTLFSLESEKAGSTLLNRLRDLVVAAMEKGDFHFVINFEKVKDFDPSLYIKLDEINHIVIKEHGILVVACLREGNEELLKELDIVSTPTLNEASDYIFMEEIERHFLSDEEEPLDESGIE
jgi:hypothetical protein